MNQEAVIDRARLADVEDMKRLLDQYAKSGDLMARPRIALYEHIRDFFVARVGGQVVGLCALHVCWSDLGEIRSLAVEKERQGQKIGRRLVEACIGDARALGISRLFTLTYKPGFFETLNFTIVDKATLPNKVWQECVNCVKFPDCDEIALIRNLGQPPKK